MCPRRRVENGQKYPKAQSKRTKLLTSFSHSNEMVSPSAIRSKTIGMRIRCRFRSVNAHAEQKGSEFSRLGPLRVRRRLLQPTAKCNQKKKRQYVTELDLFVTVKLLEDTPAILSLGKLCEDHGYFYEWTGGQKPQLIKNGRRKQCSTENYAPIVVPGLSTGSSSSAVRTSPTSVPQEAVIPTLHPASTRSEMTSSTVRWDPPHESAEIEKKKQKWRQREHEEKPVA